MSRHEFKFTVDGFDLGEADAALVAARVQAAGLAAMDEIGQRSSIGISINLGGDDNPIIEKLKWRGYWLLHAGLADKVLPGLEKGGLTTVLNGGFAR